MILRIPMSRRRFLATTAASAAITAAGGIAKPYLSRAADRPLITHGVQSGDVSTDSGCHLGTRRPPRPHAGRDRDLGQLQDHPPRRLRRCAAGERFHRQRADRRPAGRAGHLLSRSLPGSVLAHDRRRDGDRPLPHRAGRPPLDLVRMVGRHGRTGLGHRRSARRHAHLRHHAAQPSGFLHPQRRHHLCRRPDPRRAENAERRDLEERRERGQGQGRRRRSPSSAATTNTISSTRTCSPSMPRCRSSRSGTTTR